MNILVDSLSKKFEKKGKEFWAIEDVSFEAKKGEIFGLLGPNGAGKTTTFKIISTLIYPDMGFVKIGGYDHFKNIKKVRKMLGVSFGTDLIYHRLSAKDNLLYFGRIYEINNLKNRVDELLKFMGLSERADDLVEKFSLGMKSRLSIARAILHDPPILLLDEPTSGLDPSFAIDLRELISKMAKDKTILLSTHYMQEADQICDRIALIDKGKIIAKDKPEAIKSKLEKKTYLVSGKIEPKIIEKIKNLIGVKSAYISKGMIRVILKDQSYIRDLDKLVENNKSEYLKREEDIPTLEDAFISMVE